MPKSTLSTVPNLKLSAYPRLPLHPSPLFYFILMCMSVILYPSSPLSSLPHFISRIYDNIEQKELEPNLLDYFLWSNKSNINQVMYICFVFATTLLSERGTVNPQVIGSILPKTENPIYMDLSYIRPSINSTTLLSQVIKAIIII